MNFNPETQEIFCHVCKKWIDAQIGTFLMDKEVRCLECHTVLGYTYDWPELFEYD